MQYVKAGHVLYCISHLLEEIVQGEGIQGNLDAPDQVVDSQKNISCRGSSANGSLTR